MYDPCLAGATPIPFFANPWRQLQTCDLYVGSLLLPQPGSDGQWKKLNFMWVVFFMFSGAINIYVAYNFTEEFWVKFKLFGLFGITLIFVIIQSIWLNTAIKKNDS